jgi:Zn-dependent peptidase ImmA (M78 family)
VPQTTALDPFAAAKEAGIVVHGREYFACFTAEEQRQVLELGGSHWSAGTILAEGKATIILNPTHDPVRQKATLGEELAHIVMGHPPSRIDPTTGFRTYDGDVESEAYGVGGAMLMPYGQLFPLCRQAVQVGQIAARFGLSVAFTNYRINRAGLRRMYEKRMRAS